MHQKDCLACKKSSSNPGLNYAEHAKTYDFKTAENVHCYDL